MIHTAGVAASWFPPSACGRRDQPRLGETRRDEKEVQEVPPVDSEARALLRRRASLETSAHIEPESHE